MQSKHGKTMNFKLTLKKIKVKNEKKTNPYVNFCAVEYYSYTCGLHVMVCWSVHIYLDE